MANQTDVLRPYKPQTFPSLPNSAERYLPAELQHISNSLEQIVQVMKQLDARMVAAGI
jgi:hypothetical protein